MKKQLTAALLCLCLMLMLLPPIAALAAAPNGMVIYAGGMEISSTGYWTTDNDGNVSNAGTTQPSSGGYIHYDADTNTLTLHNATIKKALPYNTNTPAGTLINDAAIGVLNQSGDSMLTIQLEGQNTLSETGYGIYVLAHSDSTGEATLTITGDGSLNASGSANQGIKVQSNSCDAALIIQNAEVTATMTGAAGQGISLLAGNSSTASLTVDGGGLTTSGGTGILFDFGNENHSGTINLTVSDNAMVDTRSGGIDVNGKSNVEPAVSGNGGNGGIVFDGSTGTVYGNVILQDNLEIGEGESLLLDNGASLNAGGHDVIVDGGTLGNGLVESLGDSVKYTPTITTTDTNMPDGTVGTYYEQILAADGTTPITWSVSNGTLPNGLNLNENTGVISGIPTTDSRSTFTVRATNDYGFDSKEFTLTIDEPAVVPVTGVSLDKDSLNLVEGGNDTLNVTVQPTNAGNRVVTWESDNTSIATVDTNGKVTAVSAGTATITVKTADGSFTDTCSVMVKHGNLTHTPENVATCTEDGNGEYWTCDICGKHFSDTEGNTEITLAQTVIPVTDHHYENGRCTVCDAPEPGFKPAIITGAGDTWQKGAKDGLSFTSNAAFADFVKVQVDGRDLVASDYEVKEGSTVVTLKTSYLEMLSVGKHTLAIVSDTGTATTEFTIKAAPAADDDTQPPQTGDTENMLLWTVILLASVSILGIAAYGKRKKRKDS